MPERLITVENTTEHAFDFVAAGEGPSYGHVTVPRARLEPQQNNAVAKMRNGSAEVPELLLSRLVRDRVVRGWFDNRECVLVGTTMEALLAVELPVAKAVPGSGPDEIKRLQARIAELESEKPAKGGK